MGGWPTEPGIDGRPSAVQQSPTEGAATVLQTERSLTELWKTSHQRLQGYEVL